MFSLRASLKRRRSPPLLLAAIVLMVFSVYGSFPSGYLQPDRAMRVVAQQPGVTVTFYTNPSDVGSITFSGPIPSSDYSNGQKGSFIIGTYTATANIPSLNWALDHWEYGCQHGEIYVPNTNLNPTSVHVSSYGGEAWLKAVYSAKITFQTYPSNVGSITYDGSKYTNESIWEVRLPPGYENKRKIVANVPQHYRFVSWSSTGSISIANGTSNSTTATISGPGMVTANFEKDQFQITFQQTGIDSNYAGTVLTVDGKQYKLGELPKTFTWDSGTSHSFTWWSPLPVSSGKRCSWASTSGLSTARSDNITAISTGNITGNYQTQYYLTVKSERGTPTGGGWYDSGSPASPTAPPPIYEGSAMRYAAIGYRIDGGPMQQGTVASVTMTAPHTIEWVWTTQYQVNIDPNGGAVKINQTQITSPNQYWWNQRSNHTLEAVSPYEIGTNTRKLFTKWADGLTQNPRTITVNSPVTATVEWKIQYFLKINTPTYEKTGEGIGSPKGEGWYDKGQNASFKITSPWQREEKTRYVLLNEANGTVPIDGPKEIATKWKKQHYLKIIVNPPNAAEVKGNGPDDPWYDENSSATIQPPSPKQKDEQTRYLLRGFKWDGNFRLGNNLTVTMDKPRSIEVVYWLNKLLKVQIKQQTYQASLTTNSSLNSLEVLPSKHRLSFTVEGASGTRGVAEVLVPTQLIQASNSEISKIMVFIDGKAREAKIVSEGDYVKISMDYPHSTRKLDVYYNSYVVEVRVLSQLGILNIPMANIKLESDDGYISLSNVTDSTGRFKARLPPLSYRIEASSWSGSSSQTLTLDGDKTQGLRLIYSDDIVITFVVAGVVTGSLVVRRIYGFRFDVGQLVLYKGELMVVQSLRRDGRRKVYDLRRP